MSGGGSGGEKSEAPTEKKKRESRKEGQVARTPELGAWAGMFAAGMLLPPLVRHMFDGAERAMYRAVDVIRDPDPTRLLGSLAEAMKDCILAVLPLALVLLVVGIAATAVQGGLYPATKLLKPKLSRLNPIQGFKRTFGVHSMWQSVILLAKTGLIGLALYTAIDDLVPALTSAGTLPLRSTLNVVADTVTSLVRTASAAGLILAIGDYAISRKRTNKQVKMTKQEVKEEHKQQEGDPQLKGHIRSRQISMSRNRMIADIPDADVVVVNPVHIAVALKYDPAKGAPRVVAKGAGAVAARIREVAEEHRVPMVRDIPLARTLHRSCEIGQEIPAELYNAVAQVLAFIMRLKGKGAASGVHSSPVARDAIDPSLVGRRIRPQRRRRAAEDSGTGDA